MPYLDEDGLTRFWNKIKTLDSACVHQTGDEVISGKKSFAGSAVFSSAARFTNGATVSGGITVSSGATINGGATVSGGMIVDGAISGTVTSATNASSLGGVAASSYALDADVVKLTGSQTISGAKTFSSTISGTITSATDASSLGGVAASGYVTTSGAQEISGNKTFSDTIIAKTGDFIVRDVDDSYLRINGSTASTKGGSVLMYGKDSSICAGWTVIQANDGTSSCNLDLTPSGSLMWGGKGFVFDSTDQTIAGNKTLTGSTSLLQGQAYTVSGLSIARSINIQDVNRVTTHSLNFQMDDNGGYIWLGAGHKSNVSNDLIGLWNYASGSPYFGTAYGNRDKWDLGGSSRKWSKVYAVTGTIQTSDERKKDNISAVPDTVLDAWGEVDWKQFQLKASITEKGVDKARLHNGLIAQRIDAIFTAHGLDASRYGLFCYDEWSAQDAMRDAEGNIMDEAHEAGNEYSIRYDEALCMEAAYQRRRADRAEARIASLEQRLDELEQVIATLGD